MSEPNIALSRAPKGFTLVLKAVDVMGSSASHPKKSGTNRSRMSSARVMRQAAHSSRVDGSSTARVAMFDERAQSRPPPRARRPCRRTAAQLSEERDVDAAGIERGERVDVALLQWPRRSTKSIAAHATAPCHERERHVGEATGDATEEQRLAHRVVALVELPDVVVHVVGVRHATAPAHRARVERRRNAELAALLPHPGRSRSRCRRHTYRPTCPTTARSGCASANASAGRCTKPFITTALNPSSPTACSSSSTASSGVTIGMAATGVNRSPKPANASAL